MVRRKSGGAIVNLSSQASLVNFLVKLYCSDFSSQNEQKCFRVIIGKDTELLKYTLCSGYQFQQIIKQGLCRLWLQFFFRVWRCIIDFPQSTRAIYSSGILNTRKMFSQRALVPEFLKKSLIQFLQKKKQL